MEGLFYNFFSNIYCLDTSFMCTIFVQETGENAPNRVQIGQLTSEIQHNSLNKAAGIIRNRYNSCAYALRYGKYQTSKALL